MKTENTINELIEIIKPYMSSLPCESESGSCELTSCRECRARELANKICTKEASPQEAITACDNVLTEKYYVEEPEDD